MILFSASRKDEAFSSWLGTAKAASRKAVKLIRLADDSKVILEPWATSDVDQLENIARINHAGEVVWRARLPRAASKRDCFVKLLELSGRLRALTWSGQVVDLCPETGLHLAER